MKARLLKIAYFGIPAVAIAISILALNSGPLLKRPSSPAEDIPALMAEIGTLAVAEQWAEASALAEQVDQVWDRMQRRLAFSSDQEDLKGFDMGLAELRGALEARDQQQVRIIHRRLLALWSGIGS